MTARYSIDDSLWRDLNQLADRLGGSAGDYAALDRLRRAVGDDGDVERAAQLYESADEGANAADLRRRCFGPSSPGGGDLRAKRAGPAAVA